MTEKLHADVAVIGGGIAGLACAYELSKRGQRVVVLERQRAGSGAAGVAAGMLAPISEAEAEDRALVDLALESCRLYPQWVAEAEAASGLPCGYRDEGSLLVALHRDHEEEIERLAAIQRSLDLEARVLTRQEALQQEPYLSPRVVSGLLIPGDTQVNPRQLTRALAAALTANGSRVIEGETASLLLEGGRAAGATTPRIELRAAATLIAGGAWSRDVWPDAAGPLPLRPVKGQIIRLQGEQLVQHVLRTPDVYLVPRADGELVIGATSEEQGFDMTVRTWAVMDLLREAWRVLPGIAELELAETAAGLRPTLRDHLPALGATAVEGLFVATGHYRHGIMLAPVTGQLVAEAIVSGHAPEALRPFDPKRLLKAETAAGQA